MQVGGSWQSVECLPHHFLHSLWSFAKSKCHSEVLVLAVGCYECRFVDVVQFYAYGEQSCLYIHYVEVLRLVTHINVDHILYGIGRIHSLRVQFPEGVNHPSRSCWVVWLIHNNRRCGILSLAWLYDSLLDVVINLIADKVSVRWGVPVCPGQDWYVVP
ncbi:unnamed protein product [Ixodes pacificus]